MKVLILGGSGMIGHSFFLSWRKRHDVRVTLKEGHKDYLSHGFYNPKNSFFNCDASTTEKLIEVIDSFEPDCIVNCIGVTKQLCCQENLENVLMINSLLPHKIDHICKIRGIRFIHLSTDCVFTGEKGNYKESDTPDATDLYGRSKALGEVDSTTSLTIRKSTIGLELNNKHGLLEWFLAQEKSIEGYSGAIYSGLSTSHLASIIEEIIIEYPGLNKILNIASEPISKFTLLCELRDRLEDCDIEIIEDDKISVDRSLAPLKLLKETDINIPSWDQMLDDLAKEINERKYDIK
tara:strand:- start:4689 stop:5567 length:879 start_codon:yes stop_codon:yes gene_type:complete